MMPVIHYQLPTQHTQFEMTGQTQQFGNMMGHSIQQDTIIQDMKDQRGNGQFMTMHEYVSPKYSIDVMPIDHKDSYNQQQQRKRFMSKSG